jgi:AcrR family transcriptional regulator
MSDDSKRPTGRPSKKTKVTRARLIEAAGAGYASLEAICRAAGISYELFRQWREEDPSIETEVRSAQEQALDTIENAVLTKAREDARVGLAVLKSRRPDGYNERAKVEVTGKDGGPIVTAAVEKVAGLTDAELEAALARLEAAVADESAG